MKRFKRGFTLAEVLITLAIIGVVAAISIPSVISNSQQQEFKTGLRKAVSVLNSAITMNMAIDGESPYDNANLYGYLQRHMAILKTTTKLPYSTYVLQNNGNNNSSTANSVFYTTDGMRFEFADATLLPPEHGGEGGRLHESKFHACSALNFGNLSKGTSCGGCGSYGLKANDVTNKPPCLILVDVNGDKKPTPGNVYCSNTECAKKDNVYKVPLPAEKKVRDIFSILITEDRAIPYGVTAQKAMYQAQK